MITQLFLEALELFFSYMIIFVDILNDNVSPKLLKTIECDEKNDFILKSQVLFKSNFLF